VLSLKASLPPLAVYKGYLRSSHRNDLAQGWAPPENLRQVARFLLQNG
jgi:hypothetical protein